MVDAVMDPDQPESAAPNILMSTELPTQESPPDGRIEVIRDLLDRGLHNQVIHEGRQLCGVLNEPSDLATLQVLIGRAEMFNGRLGPAVQRFRLAEYGDLNPGDRLRLGISEAMVRFGSGGVASVIEVIDELEANANEDNLTLAATAGLRAWTSIEQSNTTRAVELAKVSNERALRHDDDDLIVLSWLILGLSTTAAGDIEFGAKALATGIEHSTKSKHVAALPVLHLVAADTDHLRGRLAHSRYHARLSIESSEPISSGAVGVGANGLLAILADRCGEHAEAAGYVIDAERALLRGAPLGWGNLALARLRLDRSIDPEQAALRLLDVWRYLDDQGSIGYASIFSVPVAELTNRLKPGATTREIMKRLRAIRPPSLPDGFARDLALAAIDEDLTTAVGIVLTLEQSRSTHLALVGDSFALVANLLEQKSDKRSRMFADEARVIYGELQADGDLARLLSRHPAIAGSADPVLSAAEKRVVALVIDGRSNAEIAQELFLSIKTVEAHLARIYRRFGLKSRLQLVRFCEANLTGL